MATNMYRRCSCLLLKAWVFPKVRFYGDAKVLQLTQERLLNIPGGGRCKIRNQNSYLYVLSPTATRVVIGMFKISTIGHE